MDKYNIIFKSHFTCIYLSVCACVCVCVSVLVLQHSYGDQKERLVGVTSFSRVWVPGIKMRLSDLMSSALIHGDIFQPTEKQKGVFRSDRSNIVG